VRPARAKVPVGWQLRTTGQWLDPGRLMLALDSAPYLFKTAPRVVNGPVPAGEDCLGAGRGEVRVYLSRGQPRSAAEIHPAIRG
jgi:hypothetical protein